ncbi:hypothetical protein CPC08DRAFT_769036 [Agrocybe pediades]|nr:hypothetical protein CPC08DRAFT_769036 [Agrocybe pediades]
MGTRAVPYHIVQCGGYMCVNLVNLMLRRFELAVPTAFEQSLLHEDFTNGIGSVELIAEWSEKLAAWENDHSKENPFERKYKGITLDSVQLSLAEQERKVGMKEGLVLHESTSASQLISMGMELEIQQRKIAIDLKNLSKTDHAKAQWTLRSNTLRRKINNWIEIQHLYIPGLVIHRQKLAVAARENGIDIPSYDINLFLPSEIPPSVACDGRLADIEFQLRYAQCTEALDDLRNALCLRAYVILDKARFQVQRGRRAVTRSQGVIDRVQAKVDDASETYRRGREALVNLAKGLGRFGWERDLQELKPEDVRPLSDDEAAREKQRRKEKRQPQSVVAEEFGYDVTGLISEGHRTVSWIWRQMGGQIDMNTGERLHESMRIEWCKSKARLDRWVEEVALLKEEKRRILAFFEYRAKQWDALASDTTSGDPVPWMLPGVRYDPVAISGRHAYAREQADQFRRMHGHFLTVWQNVDQFVDKNGEGVPILPEGMVLCDVEDEDDENVPKPPVVKL